MAERRTVPIERPPKVVRSYRLVFHRRWRLFHIQGWRIPLPGGLELRAIGYWLLCLGAAALLAALPAIGIPLAALPVSLRLVALPLLGAWALCRWELDGRGPLRALAALAAWRLRPRTLAGLRGVPAVGAGLPADGLARMTPDLLGARYPRGRLRGPARVLLRYPVQVRAERVPPGPHRERAERLAAARRWRLRALDSAPLHRGHVLEVPAGRVVIFE